MCIHKSKPQAARLRFNRHTPARIERAGVDLGGRTTDLIRMPSKHDK